MKSNSNVRKILILNDIRSAQNVGSLFRTADALGVTEIVLSAITPAPRDKFGRSNSQIAKAALGAEETISWKQVSSIIRYVKKIQGEGVHVIAIEQSPKSIDYKKIKIKGSIAFILGNEVEGIPKKLLDVVNSVAEIPMNGKKESLNVSVAGGIAISRILNV